MGVHEATLMAIAAAPYVDRVGADAGTVEAMLALAKKIDAWDEIVDLAMEQAAESERKPTVPVHDNTSLPTFLRYCEALGLTPATRKALAAEVKAEGDAVDELKKRRGRKQASSG